MSPEPTQTRRKRVMVVEDEALVALTIEEALIAAGYVVCGVAARAGEALEIARVTEPDLAVIDVRLAGGDDGIALAETLARSLPVLILFATGNPAEVRDRARVGAGCLAKPFEAEWLLGALEAIQLGGQTHVPNFFALPLSGPPPPSGPPRPARRR